jgi:hypothetical protein
MHELTDLGPTKKFGKSAQHERPNRISNYRERPRPPALAAIR